MNDPARHPAYSIDRSQLGAVEINPVFARPAEATEFSKFRLPASESLPETA